MCVKIGFFKEFRGEDSILISTDINGLLELEKIFENLSKEMNEFDFLNLESLDKKHFLNLKLYADNSNIGLKEIEGIFEWRVDKIKWKNFREKLTSMIRNSLKSHNYFDSDANNSDDYQVVISLNEYDDKFWDENNNSNLIKICDECRSDFFVKKSKMENLCPNCAHLLY